MDVREFKYDSWRKFREGLDSYHDLSWLDRGRYVFRGQADAAWPIRSTLQRYIEKLGTEAVDRVKARLSEEFLKTSVGVSGGSRLSTETVEIQELLARHHGLPSSILDWTRSPYVAAYFAFADPIHESNAPPDSVSIWSFDLGQLDASNVEDDVLDQIDVIDSPSAIESNPRAIEQDSVFIRLAHDVKGLDELVPTAITRFVLPTSERMRVLGLLDSMRINKRTLFRDLDAAAATATLRVGLMEHRDG